MTAGRAVVFLPGTLIEGDAGKEGGGDHVVDRIGGSLGRGVAVVDCELQVGHDVVGHRHTVVAGTLQGLGVGDVDFAVDPDHVTVGLQEFEMMQGTEETGDAAPVVGSRFGQVGYLVDAGEHHIGLPDPLVRRTPTGGVTGNADGELGEGFRRIVIGERFAMVLAAGPAIAIGPTGEITVEIPGICLDGGFVAPVGRIRIAVERNPVEVLAATGEAYEDDSREKYGKNILFHILEVLRV